MTSGLQAILLSYPLNPVQGLGVEGARGENGDPEASTLRAPNCGEDGAPNHPSINAGGLLEPLTATEAQAREGRSPEPNHSPTFAPPPSVEGAFGAVPQGAAPDPSTISDTPPLPGPHVASPAPSYDTGEPDVLPSESPAPAPLLNLGSRFPLILP